MNKLFLFGCFALFSFSVNAQSNPTVKENQPAKEFADESKSVGLAQIVIFISIDGKEVQLPIYEKNNTSLKAGMKYAEQLMSELKAKGVKVERYDMTFDANEDVVVSLNK